MRIISEASLTSGARNIVAMYLRATPQEVEDGSTWYDRAHGVAKRLAMRSGVSVEKCAAVIAALSPNNRWERNVIDAEATLQAFRAGSPMDTVRVTTYRHNLKKAWDILTGRVEMEHAFSAKTGPKTLAFFNLIADPFAPEGDVCVDGHAAAVWAGERIVVKDAKVRPGRQYDAIAEDYRLAGRFLGIPAHVVQAVTWTVYRRIHQSTMRNSLQVVVRLEVTL